MSRMYVNNNLIPNLEKSLVFSFSSIGEPICLWVLPRLELHEGNDPTNRFPLRFLFL